MMLEENCFVLFSTFLTKNFQIMVSNEILLKRLDLLQADLQDLKRKIGLPPAELLTYQEAMDLLKCSRNTMDRLRKEGLLKVYTLRGKLYCKHSEIMDMINDAGTEAA